MKLVSILVITVVALQSSCSTAQIDFVRSNDHHAIDFSTISNPTQPPVSDVNNVEANQPLRNGNRRLRDGSATGTIIVGRNGGGYEPLRDGETHE
ncbi:hypothetical protein P3T76_006026 [Phytophthora citrophthora]|uniref:RxLR effector protein n=1 Tax=Phytophthora citrophthora TaxID=4793 RepID=A0AAD9GPU6_9STRA|nr:hypothetical protein P3T76_006026 [Phytophthora citrophthora]